MSNSVRHIRNGTLALAVICCLAVIGYMTAGWSALEASYMAVITVFTVGYGETLPINTPELRLFTMAFVVLGCTTYLYIGGALVQFLIEGQIETTLGKRRMTRNIEELNDHTIICGFGRVGRMLAVELHAAGRPFVVVETNEEMHESIQKNGTLVIQGDATSEEVLQAAGIERAGKIAVVLPDDAANVFITLSARNLNDDLFIIARGVAPSTERKLIQAGANQVVLPEHIEAQRMANLILRPVASSLFGKAPQLAHITDDLAEFGLHIEEFSVPNDSNIVGLTLADLEMKGSSAFLIVAVVRESGDVIHKPALETSINRGDTLVTLCHEGGTPEFTRIFNVSRKTQYRGATL